jgi:hypothetical protein
MEESEQNIDYMEEESNDYNYYNSNNNNILNNLSNQKSNIVNKINKLYNFLDLYDNISLYNSKNEIEKNNLKTNNLINLLIFILSGFNIKIKESPNFNNIFSNNSELQNNINDLNLILKFLNSKFLIKSNISSEEYSLLTVYFIYFFDFFKDLLDFLKNKQNESLISFNNIFINLEDNINNEDMNNLKFNCMDNLKRIEREKSNSVLESYNKLYFIISNIKKQLDNLINQIFRLNEIKINQSFGKYKLEELLAFCDNHLFENYRSNTLYSKQNTFINKYLLNIIEAIKLYPDLYDILNKESKNYNISDDIINCSHILTKENNGKVDKNKLNIIQKLIELKYNLHSFDTKKFETFFKSLQNKIDYNISEIKNKNNQILNNEEFTNMLNQVLSQLNNYINQNILDLNNIQKNTNIDNILKEIEESQKIFFKNDKTIWESYSQFLFSIKEYLEIFYKKNMVNINQFLKIKEGIINKDYQILNKEK